jgi:hypothetical protein
MQIAITTSPEKQITIPATKRKLFIINNSIAGILI